MQEKNFLLAEGYKNLIIKNADKTYRTGMSISLFVFFVKQEDDENVSTF